MTSILVDSIVVTTDKFAELSQSNITYTTTELSWLNVSSDTTTFRIVNEAGSPVSTETVVPGNESGSVLIVGLEQKSTNKLYLQRNEHDDWIQQTSAENAGLDYVITSMKTTSVSTSIGSSAAIVQWTENHASASYSLVVTSSTGESTTFDNSSVVTADGIRSITISDLESGASYSAILSVDELKADGTSGVELWSSTFSTSEAATFQVDESFASYANISWSADGAGSEEEDGVADFRVMGKMSSASVFSEFVSSQPDSVTTATVDGLSPGTQYDLTLQRLSVDGVSWVDQASIVITTKSTSMSLQSVGSRSIELSWDSIYIGAFYELQYTPAGGVTTVFNGTTTQETSAIIKNLTPSTSYTIELYVMEQGELVGISTLALGSGAQATTGKDYTLIIGGSVLVVAVCVIVAMKLKK